MTTAMIGFNFMKLPFVAGEFYNSLPLVCRIAPVQVGSR